MNVTGKPLWLEGMFLRPQHLQQYDRWIESGLEQRIKGLLPYSWGVRQISFHADALGNGQLQISEVDLIFPDGTVFASPAGQPAPSARQITQEHQGKKIFLTLPLKASGGLDVSEDGHSEHRYLRQSTDAPNNTEGDRPPASIVIGALNAKLVIEGESLDETTSIPIAEVESVDAQGAITLSKDYISPVMFAGASSILISQMEQIRGLLRKRGEVLASGAAGQGGNTRAGIIDLMMLGVTNRYELLFGHLIKTGLNSPEEIYRECLSLIGEFSAYGADSRRPPAVPRYDHLDLRETFRQVLEILRNLLSFVVEQTAISIPLSKREYGIWLGEITDRIVFQGRQFVLIAQANVGLEVLRTQMPIQIKIGPVEKIRELVNLQLPGIGISPLSVAPRQIPYIQNAVYFALDVDNDLWPQFQDSAAFALHMSGDYPGLDLELWAIQKG
ncbi:type VI secretion system baseplate subunit TssK [Roseibium polysiphoniae]|uniref:Type VI secretion system baseplate subunit TssK n=1 Tax=Roseibium polysiphoniae TaxID=2571221 RepID=A0ABR9C9W6_9HYPH|nr:type VI secretion system baseplate subunit TssK [Roseibium polysiphoniae]MBD8876702.1 type VI secretion system baseplate subunit TssK [Roseibium polysiphoniae]